MKLLSTLLCTILAGWSSLSAATPVPMENRRELFLAPFTLEKPPGLKGRPAARTPAGGVFKFDQPWEGRFSGAFVTVTQDGRLYGMYSRGDNEAPAGSSEV